MLQKLRNINSKTKKCNYLYVNALFMVCAKIRQVFHSTKQFSTNKKHFTEIRKD